MNTPTTENGTRGERSSTMTGYATMGGIRILESPYLVIQWRFPRTKNRRIRRKWAKRKENLRPDTNIYEMPDGAIVCLPSVAAAIRQKLFPQDRPRLPSSASEGCSLNILNRAEGGPALL